MRKKALVAGVCVLLLITGCSGNAMPQNVKPENAISGNEAAEVETQENTVSEDAASENIVSENAVSGDVISENTASENAPVFVSWEDAGLEDHVMEWGGPNTAASYRVYNRH